MQSNDSNQSQKSLFQKSQYTQNLDSQSNIFLDKLKGYQYSNTFDPAWKDGQISSFKLLYHQNYGKTNTDDSFYSQSDQIKVDQSFDDEFILYKKVQKRDIIFHTRNFKQSFIKYFTDVVYGFLKQPTDLTFAIALDRLKYYSEQSPFLNRNSKAESQNTDRQNSSFNSNDSQFRKSTFSNSKTIQSLNDLKLDQPMTVQNLLKSMLYENQHQHMIFTFDYAFCHLTFIATILLYWSRLDHPVSNEHLNFLRNTQPEDRKSNQEKTIPQNKQNLLRNNIFKTLKLYIKERSQSLNICQISILIVYFLLNYLKNSLFFEDKAGQITQIRQNFINNLKLYRRIKKMEKEFNLTSNKIIFQSQLHKYQYENKLIESMEKTFSIFQFLNTHNFVSSPFQKYYELNEFNSSRKHYHLKKDYLCIWVINIILRLCEKKSAESLSKSAYYIITFLAILKKFKQNCNLEGISLILPILYNIKQQLPKVWTHAQNRRQQINDKLKQYSQMLTQKAHKKQDIPANCNAIISEQVIYQMCSKFEKYSKIDKNDAQSCEYVSIDKHKRFYQQFLVHIVYHRKQIMQEYTDEIEEYKRQKEIGISFNMYLLDTYVCKSYRGTNSKILWNKLVEKSKKVNQIINYNLYIDFIDYCFVGSSQKYKRLQI